MSPTETQYQFAGTILKRKNMEHAKEVVSALLTEGRSFTFENSSTKTTSSSGRGGYKEYINALSPAWLAWSTRTQNILARLFGPESSQMRLVVLAARVPLHHYGRDKFEQALSYYIAALQTALEILDDERDEFQELSSSGTTAPRNYSNKVFIVHGHDDRSKTELELLLTNCGLIPIVLHRQPDMGCTIIEKFEEHSDVGFVLVLLTPDDVAYPATQDTLPDDERDKEFRPRPNVIFEFGYFVGQLGRKRVCCVYKPPVKLPSDVSGMLYKQFTDKIDEAAYEIIKELQAAGYTIKLGQ